MLELCDDLVGANLDKAQPTVAHAYCGNLSARANAVWQQRECVQTLTPSLGAVNGDALILIVPDASFPQGKDAVACADQYLFAHVCALFGQAGDDDGAEQLFFLVLATDHDAAPQVCDSQSASARGDPLLAEATCAGLGGREGREGGYVVVVRAVGGFRLGGGLGAQGPDVVDVQRRRVGCEDERLRREGVDERGGVDGVVGAGEGLSIHSNGASTCKQAYVRVAGDGNLGRDLARGRVCYLDDAIGARRVQLGAVDAVGERPAAALVPARLPRRLYVAKAVLRGESRVIVAVVARACRQPVRLHVSRREAYGDNGRFRVDGLGKEIVVQRDGAHILKHGCGRVGPGGLMLALGRERLVCMQPLDSSNFLVEQLQPRRQVWHGVRPSIHQHQASSLRANEEAIRMPGRGSGGILICNKCLSLVLAREQQRIHDIMQQACCQGYENHVTTQPSSAQLLSSREPRVPLSTIIRLISVVQHFA